MIQILLIDDDPGIRDAFSALLMRCGYQVFTAEDGFTALSFLKEKEVDVILCDVKMPEMDGIEVLRKAKEIHPDTPFIMVTAHVAEEAAIEATRWGAFDYVLKPSNIQDVDLTIKRALENRYLVLENKKLMEELRGLNRSLEEKVKQRTIELEQAMSKLREAYRELEELDKTKSIFVSIASHELRTPLMVMEGYVKLALDGMGGPLNEEQRHLLEEALKGTDRLKEIVNNLIDLSKANIGELTINLQNINIRDVIDYTLATFQRAVQERNILIKVHDFDQVPIVRGDPERLKQVFFHLISNAIKFTPDGGWIELRWKNSQISNPEGISQPAIEILIKDTGIGIDPREQKRIFEPFYEVGDPLHHSTDKTKFMGRGIGIGLTIVKNIIEGHGGMVWVESEGVGHGSEFHIVLPTLSECPITEILENP
jgi:signal transduction histidine kinase